MILPSKVVITTKVDGNPLGGLLVGVSLHVTQKNNFSFIFGPSNEVGQLIISRNELIDEGEKESRLFLMDYGHPEKDFSGKITLEVKNGEGLEKAARAYKMFGSDFGYPKNYLDKLIRAANTLYSLRGEILSAEVFTEGSDCELEVRSLEIDIEAVKRTIKLLND